jgi:hypothetical protein
MIILYAGNEQKPYQISGSERGILPTGDYSLAGYTGRSGEPCGIAIERKNVDKWQRNYGGHVVEYDCGGDLVGSLTSGRDRLEAEFERGMAFDYFALVIESTLSKIARGWPDSKAVPAAIIQSLIGMSVRFNMPVWFAGDRDGGERLTEKLLNAWEVLRLPTVQFGDKWSLRPDAYSALVMSHPLWRYAPYNANNIDFYIMQSIIHRRPVWFCDTAAYAARVMESLGRHAARNRVWGLGAEIVDGEKKLSPDSIGRLSKSRKWMKTWKERQA